MRFGRVDSSLEGGAAVRPLLDDGVRTAGGVATRPDGVAKRLSDLVLAGAALVALSPLLALAALGCRLASPGPVLYRAQRVGRGGEPFVMYKLRTMHTAQPANASVITADGDPRVFPFGAWLRRTKIDELPQLFNIVRGDMSLVGPRPEDPYIVAEHYAPPHHETLAVRPGLSSPGSLFYYTHGERLIGRSTPEADYLERVLALKLALDTIYVRRASWLYDVAIIARTGWVVAAVLCGRRTFREPRELAEAREVLTPPRGVRPPAAGPVAVRLEACGQPAGGAA